MRLKLEATRRMVKGLYFDANYTFANNEADNQGDAPQRVCGRGELWTADRGSRST